MKSLEHIIREIREGKCCCEKKKDSLEHSIRKVVRKESSYAAKDSKPVDEDVGGLAGSGTGGEPTFESAKKKVRKEDSEDIKLPGNEDKMDEAIGTLGTDKYQGTEFKSIRTATPHIKPPGPEHGHSQAPENASRLRSIAKEKQGINRVTEGLVDTAVKTGYKIAQPYIVSAGTALVKYGEKAAEKILPKVKTIQKLEKPAEKAALPAPKVPETPPVTAAAPKAEPKLPEVKPTTAPETKLAEPAVKTDVKVAEPAVKTDVKVATPSPVMPAAKPIETPKVSTATQTKTAPMIVAPVTPGTKVAEPGGNVKGKARFEIPTDFADKWNQKPGGASRPHKHRSFRHHMKEETRKEIENMPRSDVSDRKDVQYVGRKKSNTTIARQATIKNVIDESKSDIIKQVTKEKKESGKTKVFPTAIVNPDLNKVDSSAEVRS